MKTSGTPLTRRAMLNSSAAAAVLAATLPGRSLAQAPASAAPANTDWKESLGAEWRQYEQIFPAIDKSPIQQVAIECRNSHVPLELLGLLKNKVVQAGVIDVANEIVETPEDVVKTIEAVMKFVPKANIMATTNCGMAPMRRDIAEAKLRALGAGAKLAREKFQ